MSLFLSEKCKKAVDIIYIQGNYTMYDEAKRLLESAASENDSDGIYFLARLYTWGDTCLEADDEYASELYIKGIRLGNERCYLGAVRQGIIKNLNKYTSMTFNEALEKLKYKADYGDSMAAYEVGCAYYWNDVDRNEGYINENYNKEQAFKYFKESADNGASLGCLNLGSCYYYGYGCDEDEEKAEVYYKLAHDRNVVKATYKLGLLNYTRKDYRTSYSYFMEAAERGNVSSLVKIGNLYRYGRYVKQDYEKAMNYYKEAVEKGDTKAIALIGDMYYDGLGVEEQLFEAASWYKRAAEEGDSYGKSCYAYILKSGIGCEANPKKSIEIFEELAYKEDDTDAYGNLALMYRKGQGCIADIKKSYELCKKGAELGEEWCIEKLKFYKKNIFGKLKYIEKSK